MILILDNYDSFTYNLVQGIGRYDDVRVFTNDAIGLPGIRRLRPDGIVISPGPGHPGSRRWFGVCGDVVRHLDGTPILGVCLGHQGIVHHLGGRVVHAKRPMHGKTSRIRHDGQGVFRSLPPRLDVARYHSLIAERSSLPKDLVVTARAGPEIMGVRHRSRPLEGVQFHPESIGTRHGQRMLQNFVRFCHARGA